MTADLDGAHPGQVRAVTIAAQRRELAAVLDPDQDISFGAGDRRDQGGGREVAVGQHHHASTQAAQQAGRVGGLPAGGGAGHRIDEGAGTARHQRQQAGLGIAGAAVAAAPSGEPGQVGRAVRHGQGGAVDRAYQHAAPPGAAAARNSGRAAQQIEQEPQRRDADPAACLRQRASRGCRHRQAGQARGELGPRPRVPQLREQARGQQQVHHHPRRQIPDQRLHRPGLR